MNDVEFSITSDNKLELFKLDLPDRKVLFWMMDHNPDALRGWIDFTAAQYARRNRNQSIDADRLFREVIIEISDDENGSGRKTWRPKNILLVDDESIYNFMHIRMLELAGVSNNIQKALNGVEALELLKTTLADRPIDVILLDLSMPVMDGFAFLEAFQKLDLPRKDKISIIVLTSSIDRRDLLKVRNLGVTQYLIKPVNEQELCGAVIGKGNLQQTH